MPDKQNLNEQTNESTNTEPVGAPSGGSDPESNPANTAGNNTPKPEPQKAAEKDDIPSAEELAAFRKWQESQKSDAQKQADAISKAQKARLEAEEKAAAAEFKLTAMTLGVSADALDDVIALAKSKITDKVTAKQAIEEIISKYPAFTGSSPEVSTGTKTPNNHNDDGADTEKIRKIMGLPTK